MDRNRVLYSCRWYTYCLELGPGRTVRRGRAVWATYDGGYEVVIMTRPAGCWLACHCHGTSRGLDRNGLMDGADEPSATEVR
jgi:hypothetical protein